MSTKMRTFNKPSFFNNVSFYIIMTQNVNRYIDRKNHEKWGSIFKLNDRSQESEVGLSNRNGKEHPVKPMKSFWLKSQNEKDIIEEDEILSKTTCILRTNCQKKKLVTLVQEGDSRPERPKMTL